MRRAFSEVHAVNGLEVELSVSHSRHGWCARLRIERSAIVGFEESYSTWKGAEQEARLLFRLLFPCHKCGESCRR